MTIDQLRKTIDDLSNTLEKTVDSGECSEGIVGATTLLMAIGVCLDKEEEDVGFPLMKRIIRSIHPLMILEWARLSQEERERAMLN